MTTLLIPTCNNNACLECRCRVGVSTENCLLSWSCPDATRIDFVQPQVEIDVGNSGLRRTLNGVTYILRVWHGTEYADYTLDGQLCCEGLTCNDCECRDAYDVIRPLPQVLLTVGGVRGPTITSYPPTSTILSCSGFNGTFASMSSWVGANPGCFDLVYLERAEYFGPGDAYGLRENSISVAYPKTVGAGGAWALEVVLIADNYMRFGVDPSYSYDFYTNSATAIFTWPSQTKAAGPASPDPTCNNVLPDVFCWDCGEVGPQSLTLESITLNTGGGGPPGNPPPPQYQQNCGFENLVISAEIV